MANLEETGNFLISNIPSNINNGKEKQIIKYINLHKTKYTLL